MFTKSRSSGATPSVLSANPIRNFYEIGKQVATAGPENLWKIYEGVKKDERRQEVSIFVFDKRSVDKSLRPKRKEIVTQILQRGAREMKMFSHPKILQAIEVEECGDTLAFVSEPVLASLANVLASQEQRANQNSPTPSRPVFYREYNLLDIEIKYGLLQITEALLHLHNNRKVIHRNVCPSSIIITKRGTWKLAGLEFIERTTEIPIAIRPWTNKTLKMIQPNLDYMAPEVQINPRQHNTGSFANDMFSFGMTICAIFNQGRSLIQANYNCSEYARQLENLEKQVTTILKEVPTALQETVSRLLARDPDYRATAQVISMINYFKDPVVHALQFLDVSKLKDPAQKEHFYTTTLKKLLPLIPRKLWYQHIWTYLEAELQTQVVSDVLQPVLYIAQNSTKDEFEEIVYPTLRPLFTSRKSVQGTVTLLENLHIILEKTPKEFINAEVLPMLYQSFENSTTQVQTAAFVAVTNITQYLNNDAIRTIILPKLLQAFENNSADPRVLMSVIPYILNRLEKQKIIDCVLPLLYTAKLQEPEIIVRVVNIYRLMLSDKKYGLSVNCMATHVMPSLLPQTVNPTLNLEQLMLLLEVLKDMLNHIERNQSNKLRLDNRLCSPEKYRSLRHQFSTDNVHVQQFNIPNLHIEQRKTSSAEDMAKKNSIGHISMTASAENMTGRKNSNHSFFGPFGGFFSTMNDKNFLAVNNFTTRRLSENTLMAPKIRLPQSCASSPGGTPGGGLPIRRHSSIGPQERRGSHINLSPPTGGGMPITSSSVPYLLSTSMNSIRSSRRPSVSSTSSAQGSGLLQQVGSSMYQFFNRQ